MATPLDVALDYIHRSWAPIPVPFRDKAPVIREWQKLHISEADASQYFNGRPQNIGVLTGSASNNLVDIDIDDPVALSIADRFLPPTPAVFGRASKPRSHRLYYCDGQLKTIKFEFLSGTEDRAHMLIEVRGDGCQTVFPGSKHPSGESIEWHPGLNREPVKLPRADLVRSAANVAAAALIIRHMPTAGQGKRHALCLALAGGLLRHGWALDMVIHFIDAVYSSEGPESVASRIKNVQSTAERMHAGIQATGLPSAKEILGDRVFRQVVEWLGLRNQSAPVQQIAQKQAPRPVKAPKSVEMEDILSDASICVPELAIEKFLPKQGLMLLGGRPKEGKSWLGCQLALSFVTGQALCGWLRVLHPGRCHLWALEDGYAITKDKVQKLLRGSRPDGLSDLRVFDELPQPILRGGDQLIRAALEEHPAELVILDSLFKLTGGTSANQDISQRDYDVIDRVRKIALDYTCAVVIIMHTKKGARGGDPIENLLGTSGNTAAADVVCELKRTGYNGKLTVTGRLVQREDYELMWHDKEEWGWAIQSSEEDVVIGETCQEVLEYLEAQGAASPATVANGIHKSFASVWMTLKRLQSRGKAKRLENKKWELVR